MPIMAMVHTKVTWNYFFSLWFRDWNAPSPRLASGLSPRPKVAPPQLVFKKPKYPLPH